MTVRQYRYEQGKNKALKIHSHSGNLYTNAFLQAKITFGMNQAVADYNLC
jgi:hypothetical protein